jgi:hypothetical protein
LAEKIGDQVRVVVQYHGPAVNPSVFKLPALAFEKLHMIKPIGKIVPQRPHPETTAISLLARGLSQSVAPQLDPKSGRIGSGSPQKCHWRPMEISGRASYF